MVTLMRRFLGQISFQANFHGKKSQEFVNLPNKQQGDLDFHL